MSAPPRTPGHAAYDADVEARPRYDDGAPRKTWEQLRPDERWSWERNPTPRWPRTVDPQ